MGFLVKNKKDLPNLWDAQAETLIALLAKRLSDIRQVNDVEVVRDLNYEYLRKRSISDKVGMIKNYGPTRLQRTILDEEGY